MDLPNTEAERMGMWDGTYVKPEPKPASSSVTTAATDTDTGNSVESQSDSGHGDALGACFGVKNLQSSSGDMSDDEDVRSKQTTGTKPVPRTSNSGGVGHASDEDLNMSSKPTPKKTHSWNPFKFGASKKNQSATHLSHSDSFETPMKGVAGSGTGGAGLDGSAVVAQTPVDTPVLPVAAPTASNMTRATRPPSVATNSTAAASVQGSETSAWKMK